MPKLKEDIIREFNEAVSKNSSNLDREYLDQIKFEIVKLIKSDDWYEFSYKIYGFDYDQEAIESSLRISSDSKLSLGRFVYSEIVRDSDPMKKDKIRKELIEKAYEEAIDSINRKNWWKFWEWFKPRKERNRYIGSCHMFWGEQKRILKEKYNIDWKTPTERNPGIKFD